MTLNQYNKQCSQTDEINTSVSICHQRHVLNRSYTIDTTTAAASTSIDERHSVVVISNGSRSDSSRDSGTSSPQPNEIKLSNGSVGSSLNTKMSNHIQNTDIGSGTTNDAKTDDDDDDLSDSNDSVFSTSSSMDEDSIPPAASDDQKQYEPRDIYLGGSCMLRTKWRHKVAIPYLNEKQISFHLPSLHENLTLKQIQKIKDQHADSDARFMLEESDEPDSSPMMYNPRILDSSRVLLFVITNETRSLAPMTLAAHYIGLGYNVVLCVQMLPENCKIGHDHVRIFIIIYGTILKFISFASS